MKDAFLLKHARRNKMGFVNLKLITSFKKMKALTKDYRQVAWAIANLSKTLIVNEQGNKIRRVDPIPVKDETTASRIVVAINLPDENLTMDSVSQLFKDCGDIALLRILKPGKPLPNDIKKALCQHPDVGSVTCAMIEFETHDGAQKAVSMSQCSENNWLEGLRVLMVASAVKKAKNTFEDDSESEAEVKQKKRNKKKTHRSAIQHEHEGFSSGSEGDFRMPQPRSRNSSFGSDYGGNRGTNGFTRNMLSPNFGPSNSSFSRGHSPTSDKFWTSPNGGVSPHSQRRRSAPHPLSPLVVESPKVTPKSSPKQSPRTSPRASPEMRRRANSGGSKTSPDGTSSSPWVQRRLAASREMSPLAKSGAMNSGGRPGDHLVRQPKGPEGSGFYGGKGRGTPLKDLS